MVLTGFYLFFAVLCQTHSSLHIFPFQQEQQASLYFSIKVYIIWHWQYKGGWCICFQKVPRTPKKGPGKSWRSFKKGEAEAQID